MEFLDTKDEQSFPRKNNLNILKIILFAQPGLSIDQIYRYF